MYVAGVCWIFEAVGGGLVGGGFKETVLTVLCYFHHRNNVTVYQNLFMKNFFF